MHCSSFFAHTCPCIVTRLDFAIDTPSPPAPIRTYPFADGKIRSSVATPSPPQRKNSLLQRLQGSKHKALRRISNPLLSAAYKLGEQQNQLNNHIRNLSNATETGKGPRPTGLSISNSYRTSKFEKDFTMLEPIGNGEFSTVWKVKQKSNGLLWAVKRGKPYRGMKDRCVAIVVSCAFFFSWLAKSL